MPPRTVLIAPDPEMSTSLTVYAPVWIAPDASADLVGSVAPGAHVRMDAAQLFGAGGLEAVGQEALERLVAEIGEDVLDEAGFSFTHPDLEQAARWVVSQRPG